MYDYVRLGCGPEISVRCNQNPFKLYGLLRDVKKHHEKCLPCLMQGTFKRMFEKQIVKIILMTVVRLTTIISIWGCLIASFIYSHRGSPALVDNDAPYILLAALAMGASLMATLIDGPREFNN